MLAANAMPQKCYFLPIPGQAALKAIIIYKSKHLFYTPIGCNLLSAHSISQQLTVSPMPILKLTNLLFSVTPPPFFSRLAAIKMIALS